MSITQHLALQNIQNRNPKWWICLHHNPKWRIVLINSKWWICLHHNPKWRIVLIETLPREGICKSCTLIFILNFWKSKHTSKKSNYLTEMQYSIQLLVFVKITPKMNMVFETYSHFEDWRPRCLPPGGFVCPIDDSLLVPLSPAETYGSY